MTSIIGRMDGSRGVCVLLMTIVCLFVVCCCWLIKKEAYHSFYTRYRLPKILVFYGDGRKWLGEITPVVER